MRSIGEMARSSGLSVSALRFYDGAGVFGPAWVDPQTGYRWYADDQLADARLIARLRRVGMPLADISRVLGDDLVQARNALDGHLRRLEDGLADARRELSTVRMLLEMREKPMSPTRLTVPAAALAAALDAVRFAANAGPEHFAVAGMLFEAEAGVLRLVATDRYRLAVSETEAELDGPAVSALVPTSFVDALRPLLTGSTIELVIDELRLTASAGANELSGERIDQDFPDYRRLLHLDTTHRAEISAQVLRERLAAANTRTATRRPDGEVYDVAELTVGEDGTLTVGAAGTAGGLRVAVNRDFLLEALAAGDSDQLVLEFGGPITPLAIRFPSRADTFSLLMPTAP